MNAHELGGIEACLEPAEREVQPVASLVTMRHDEVTVGLEPGDRGDRERHDGVAAPDEEVRSTVN